MVSKGIKFIKSLFAGLTGKPKDRVLTNIDEALIEKEQKVREITKYARSLEAQLSKIDAKKRHTEEKEKDFFDEVKLIKELKDKSEDIRFEKEKYAFNLFLLFKYLTKNKKFANSLEICDMDDKTVFDKFGTIAVMDNGDLALIGKKGQIITRGKKLSEIIFKPDTLKNQIRRKRILIPYDEHFRPYIDLSNEEIPEMSYNPEEDKWNISEERLKPIKEMIMERDETIFNLRQDKEHHEQVIADLRNTNQDIELAKKNWQSQTMNSQSELSIALENEKQAMGKLSTIQRDLTKAQEQKAISEDLKDVHEDANKRVLGELEKKESANSLRLAKNEIQADVEWAKDQIPEIINQTIKEEEVTKSN